MAINMFMLFIVAVYSSGVLSIEVDDAFVQFVTSSLANHELQLKEKDEQIR